jgi:hypothetical protein
VELASGEPGSAPGGGSAGRVERGRRQGGTSAWAGPNVAQSGLRAAGSSALDRIRRSNGWLTEGARLNPGLDPLDPLELALLMEAAEDLADLDRDAPPRGRDGRRGWWPGR